MKKRLISILLMITVVMVLLISTGCNNKNINETITYQGKIISISDNNNFVIRVNDSADLISLSINEEVEFGKDVSNAFSEGNLVEIETGPEVMESWPLQVSLYKITKNEPPAYLKISQEVAKKIIDTQESIVLDVRTINEYKEGHIENTVLLPVDQIEEDVKKVLDDKYATILVCCRSGNRSKSASLKLIELGYKNVYDFGGLKSWEYEIVK